MFDFCVRRSKSAFVCLMFSVCASTCVCARVCVYVCALTHIKHDSQTDMEVALDFPSHGRAPVPKGILWGPGGPRAVVHL